MNTAATTPAQVNTITSSLPVRIDRNTVNARGRSATIFVDHTNESTTAEIREAASAHLLPGEHLQGDVRRRTGFEDFPFTFEFAVFS